MSPAAQRTGIAVLLVALIAIAFGPATGGELVWDDNLLIANNARLRSAEHLGELLTSNFWNTSVEADTASQYYRPVVALAYFAQFQAFGLAPRGYHLVSLALHVAVALLALAWLRRRIEGVSDARSESIAAAFGALLFALHPTRTESVTWIAGSTDLWMTLFVLLCAQCAERARSLGAYVATALLAALALLSKETAIVLPALLWLDSRWLAIGAQEKQTRARAALAAALGMALAMIVRLQLVPLPPSDLGALPHGFFSRVLGTLGHYVQATLAPFSPSGLRGEVWITPDGGYGVDLSTLAAGAGIVVLGIALALRGARSASEDPRASPATHRPWLADTAWLVLPLSPVLNVVPTLMTSLASDRFLYWPMLGCAALLARAVAKSWPERPPTAHRIWIGSGALLLPVFIAVIQSYGRAFASERALWEYELARDPERAYVLERNTDLAIDRGDFAQAIELALHGEQLARRTGRPTVQHQFMLAALVAQRTGTPDLEQDRLHILRDFYDALASAKPGQPVQLALPALRFGEYEALPAMQLKVAFTAREHAILEASTVRFQLGRASLYARTLELARAGELLQALVAAKPKLVEAWSDLAILRARRGDFAGAQRALQTAQAAAPANRAVLAAARAIGAAQHISQRKTGDALQDALLDAQSGIVLGAYSLVRQQLDRALGEHPLELGLIAMRARLDAIDRRPDLALARVADAARMLPQAEPALAPLKAELLQMIEKANATASSR